MLLKRIYDKPDGWEPIRNVKDAEGKLVDPSRPEGICLNPPPLAHVELRNTGWTPAQNFSSRMVEAGVAEGWMVVRGKKLVLHVQPETLIYTITRMPGRYCLHCGEKLPDDEKGVFARAHVQAEHDGVASPDPAQPAGYECLNYYACVLDQAQHEKWAVRPGERRDQRLGRLANG